MTDSPRRFRVRLRSVSIAYFAVLAVILFVMHWWAEYFLPLWLLLFAPVSVLLLPVPFLAAYAAARRRWRWLVAYGVCSVLVLFAFSRFRIGSSAASPDALTVVTHNIGQGNKLAFADAFPGETLDVILLQDARYREKDYARNFPNLRAKGVAQFLLLTPHEITQAALVKEPLWRGKPVAARFAIRKNGREIALYNVHLPTPRRSLRHAFTPRVMLEMLWLAEAPTDDHPSYRSWLRARVTLAEQLAGVFARETLPFIVAGDLNTPARGMVYRSFASRLQDAHADAGSGWGHTFPANARKDGLFARVFGPWLRLDYIFAGRGLKPVECRVASDNRSQHRAVLARLALQP